MIKIINIELFKLIKSKTLYFTFLFCILFNIFICFENLNKYDDFFSYVIICLIKITTNYFFYQIVTIFLISDLFAKDIETRTILYWKMKPIKSEKIIINKVLTCIFVTLFIYAINFFIITILGLFTTKIYPFTIAMDKNLVHSIIRVVLLTIIIIIGIVYSTFIGTIVSLKAKNKLLTIIFSMPLLIALQYPIYFKNKVFSILFYTVSGYKIEQNIFEYFKYVLNTSIIAIFITYLLYLVSRKMFVKLDT